MNDIAGKPIEFVSQEVDITFTVQAGVSSGTMFHDLLSNRGYDDQHPIAAITGLIAELEGKQSAGELDEVDNISDANKPVSIATQDALDLKTNKSDIDQVNNTSDTNKPVSTLQQAALDAKASVASVSEVTNTSDADKPVSTAQQAALDLKVDKTSYFSFFGFNSASDVNVTADQPAYQEILRLTMSDLDAGKYATTISGRVQSDKVGKTVYIRWSVDGGASWDTPAGYNVLDATEKRPFTVIEFDDFTAGGRVIIFEAAKDVSVTSMIINELSIACERKV